MSSISPINSNANVYAANTDNNINKANGNINLPGGLTKEIKNDSGNWNGLTVKKGNPQTDCTPQPKGCPPRVDCNDLPAKNDCQGTNSMGASMMKMKMMQMCTDKPNMGMPKDSMHAGKCDSKDNNGILGTVNKALDVVNNALSTLGKALEALEGKGQSDKADGKGTEATSDKTADMKGMESSKDAAPVDSKQIAEQLASIVGELLKVIQQLAATSKPAEQSGQTGQSGQAQAGQTPASPAPPSSQTPTNATGADTTQPTSAQSNDPQALIAQLESLLKKVIATLQQPAAPAPVKTGAMEQMAA